MQAADSISNPMDYPNLFEELEYALQAEEWASRHQLHEAPAKLCVLLLTLPMLSSTEGLIMYSPFWGGGWQVSTAC